MYTKFESIIARPPLSIIYISKVLVARQVGKREGERREREVEEGRELHCLDLSVLG